jgi:RNA polymerase sigma-70 factor (ECF subfamily)
VTGKEPDPRVSAALVEHQQFLRAVARSLLTGLDGVDDVVQETARRALESPPRHQGNLRAWLGTVARRLALRSRHRESTRAERERQARGSGQLPSPDRLAEEAEIQSRLAAAVAALDEPYRSAIMLRFFEDLSPREIAQRSDAPLQTVHTRIRRGVDQLRARLDAETPGGRRAWSLALLPLAFGREVLPPPVPTSTWIPAAAAGAAIGLASFGVGWATAPEPEREPVRAAPLPVAVEEPAPVEREQPESIEVDYLARINEAVTWKDAREIGREIAALENGREVILDAFPQVTNWKYRRHLLDSFLWWGVHPHAAEILEMGARDPHFRVRQRALDLAGDYLAFRDFSRDYDGFFEWFASVRGFPLNDLILRSARLRADELRASTLENRPSELTAFENGHLLIEALWEPAGIGPATILRETGIEDLVRRWAFDAQQPARVRASSMRILAQVDRSRELRENKYLPILDRAGEHDRAIVRAALQGLGYPECAWAVPRILAAYSGLPEGVHETWGWTLKRIGDPTALPHLVALRVLKGPGCGTAEPLREMTGVLFEDAAPDGWWEQWWIDHRPEPVELPLERYR